MVDRKPKRISIFKEDIEKYVTGTMFMLATIACVYKFLIGTDTAIVNMTYFALGLGGLFVTRKAVSYFKPEQYYSKSEKISREQ